jgi:hypothetical protein
MPRGGWGEFGQFEELFVAVEGIRELLRTIDNLYGISMDFLLQEWTLQTSSVDHFEVDFRGLQFSLVGVIVSSQH